MTPQRTGLGKGLDALIPGGEAASTGGVMQIAIDTIQRNPRQPRDQFDAQEMEELAASIREHGILQPLILSPGADGTYTLVAGERRLQAAKLAGLRSVPAILRQVSDRELLELALIENIQRAELNPLEEAEAYRQLSEDFGLSHEEIALRVGKSRPAVSNTLRLLHLSPAVKQALIEGYAHIDENDRDLPDGETPAFRLSEGHARALLGLPGHTAQDAALKTILAHRLNVRQTEELVKKMSGQKAPPPQPKTIPPEITALEDRLRASLGTKVTLRHGRKGGTVTIHYYSDEELDSLLERLL
ncbi:MAG: ParB/RepB/Spo0J family partition protein [Anaerolineales bacterium]